MLVPFCLGLQLAAPSHLADYALVGVTVIDVSAAEADLEDAVVLIRDGMIQSIAARKEDVSLDASLLIDARGKFLIPGLIDSFATLNDQRYADAYIHSGVTSIIGVSGGRRGDLFTEGAPAPTIFRLESVGSDEGSLQEYRLELERLALEGVDVLLLMYELEAEELRSLSERAHELGMATIGELGRTRYAAGADLGLDAYVHTTRYSLDIAPPAMRQAVADEPFSDDLASPKWTYYLHLADIPEGDARLAENAAALAATGVALIPTFSLLYLDMPWATNPWQRPIAQILQADSIHRPADSTSGKHTDGAAHMQAYARMAEAVMKIESANVRAGCRYIAGSGTDVWGSMPGISLHTELEALGRVGLPPREVLRSATIHSAEVFGFADRGRVASGLRADLLLLAEDPRESTAALESITHVFCAGRLVDRDALLARERDADGEIVGQRHLRLPTELLKLTADGAQLEAASKHLAELALSEITYLSDGLRVKAMLAVPRGAGPFPALVYCRGGNRSFGEITDERARNFLATVASWGYVVIAPQYRGNRGGEGQEEFGGADVNDVLNVLPLLRAHPKADATRIGLYGGSRGAMMGLSALRRSSVFRAAIFRCGLTDLVQWKVDRPGVESVYEELIPGYSAQDDSPLIERSAINWASELPKSTPILWMHGTADWRVSPESGLRFAAALQRERHPYRLVMFEGADHGLSGFTDERDQLTREWLDRYVRDEAPAPEMEPHGN